MVRILLDGLVGFLFLGLVALAVAFAAIVWPFLLLLLGVACVCVLCWTTGELVVYAIQAWRLKRKGWSGQWK